MTLTVIDSGLFFPIAVADRDGSDARTVHCTTKATTPTGQLVLLDREGRAYVPNHFGALRHVPAPEFDQTSREDVKPNPQNDHDSFTSAQLIDSREGADIIREPVRSIAWPAP